MVAECDEKGVVDIGGESVRFEMCTIDARSAQQQSQDVLQGKPAGNIMVLVPGHGQGIHGPKKLAAAAARLSRSKIVWCIDPVPAIGGDHVEGQAIGYIVRRKASATFPASQSSVMATLIGWSHGASEALRAAGQAPDLFPQFLGLCPLGLAQRPPWELVGSFFREASRSLWASAYQRNWACLRDTVRLGLNAGSGLLRDLWHSRSVGRLIEDIDWAGKKVTGTAFEFPGEVVLLFGEQDTVVRWQDAFPECARPEEISQSLKEYGQQAFPRARRVNAQVIPGAHVGPEANAPTFLRTGLGLLGQLDTSTESKRH